MAAVSSSTRAPSSLWIVAMALPAAGLSLLLAAPEADVRWEHHPSHFWLVLAAAVATAVLAYGTGESARRRGEPSLLWISNAFLAATLFLGLHALATPGVLLEGRNAGFAAATPAGLLLASVCAAASTLPVTPSTMAVALRRARWAQLGLPALAAVWAAFSLAALPPLDRPGAPEGSSAWLLAPATAALVLFGFAALHWIRRALRRRSSLVTAIATAWVLLAEAALAVAVARNWHASWWEWHVLILTAFMLVAWAAHRAPPDERYSDLYDSAGETTTREISVLFADLAGYTAFAETRAPADVRTMLDTVFRVAVPAIEEHGAQVERMLGDAVMATFNVRGDQPDHAARAAAAGLALQRESAELLADNPAWPRFRVGVNSGPAVIAVLGGGSGRSHAVVGDVVNVAARLEQLAPPGAVAVGAATRAALGAAMTRPLGATPVHGRAAPVEAYLLDRLEP